MAVDGKRDGGRRRRRRKGVRRHPIYATDAAFYTGGREGGREAVGRLLSQRTVIRVRLPKMRRV